MSLEDYRLDDNRLDYSLFANSEYEPMAMKPQDVVVALKLLFEGEEQRPYAVLASDLGMSASEVHGAVGRLREGRLVEIEGRRVRRRAFRDFLVSGIGHVFPAREGEPARGVPTAWAAPVLEGTFKTSGEGPPVWPHPKGTARGPSIAPLYKSVPDAVLKDSVLYDCLALVDTIRLGRARERKAAIEVLDKLILSDG